jgi:hypothetical protein
MKGDNVITKNDIFITRHAKEKFRKLTNYKGSENKTLTKLIYMMEKKVPFEPDSEYKVKSLIRHNFRPTEYFLSEGYVLVVVNGNLATIFAHKAGDKTMWRPY